MAEYLDYRLGGSQFCVDRITHKGFFENHVVGWHDIYLDLGGPGNS